MTIQNTDLLVVQRSDTAYKIDFENLKDNVIDAIPNGQRVTVTVSSATQRVFNVSPSEIESGGELVYLNGTLLNAGADYDVTGTSEVTLAKAAVLGDIFEIFCDNTVTGERQNQNLGYRKDSDSGIVTITDGSNAVIEGATTSDAGLLTASDKQKLNGIATGAQVNVQSNWNTVNITSDSYIQNKPDIPNSTSDLINDSGFITVDGVPVPEAPNDNKQYARKNEAWSEVDIPAGFSGDYNDLTNKPTIGDAKLTVNDSSNAKVGEFTANQTTDVVITLPAGFSGDYDDLTNTPTIGDGDLIINDSEGNSLGTFNANQTGDTTVVIPAPFSGDYDDLINTPNSVVRVTITVSDPTQSVFNTSPVEITSGSELVYLNGTLLNSGSDYDVTGDSQITLDKAAVLGDIFELFSNDTITGERVTQNLGYRKRASSGVVTITDGSNAVIDGATTADAGLLTAADKVKLNGIEQGAEVNIQSDWNAGNSSSAHIKNKPTIGSGTLTVKNSDGSTAGTFGANQTNNTTINLPEGFSGDYGDLTNKPDTLVTKIVAGAGVTVNNGGIGEVTVTSTVDQLEFGGSADVTSSTVPSTTFNAVPLAIADFYVNVGFGKFSAQWAAVTDNATTDTDADPGDYLVYNGTGFEHIPSGTPPAADPNWIAAGGTLEPVNKNNQVVIGNSTADLSLYIVGRARSAPTRDSDGGNTLTTKGYVLDKIPTVGEGTLTVNLPDGTSPTFGANQTGDTEITIPAPFSGDYDDLTDKPTIGTGELTLTQGGEEVGKFSANATSDLTLDVAAPFSGDYDDLSNTPTIGTGSLIIKNADNTVAATFNANATDNTNIKLPDLSEFITTETQSDWNVTSDTSAAFIKNKPSLTGFLTAVTVDAPITVDTTNANQPKIGINLTTISNIDNI